MEIKLNRDYINNPLKHGEYPEVEDVKFLFLVLNLSREECAKICNCNPEKIKIVCQQNKFSKTKEQRAELRKKTLQQKYGVTNISQLKEIKDKKKQTTLKNYGVENPAQSSEIKNKMKETCLEKYDVESTNSLPDKKEKIKKTIQEKYGVDNIMQVFDVQEKQKQTCIEKYGVDNAIKNKEIKDKKEQTCLDKYGKENLFGTEYFKKKSEETCLKKYKVTNIMKTEKMKQYFKTIKPQIIAKIKEKQDETLKKILQTKRQNHSFTKSQPEDKVFEQLIKLFPNTQRQYNCELYPFACDFYIPELDLYIEYNGTWTHGAMPFENNESCNRQLQRWQEKAKTSKFYQNAIYTWTDLDVRKRQTAKQNNLNWLEFFSMTEFNTWYKQICKML